jgi:hypothetical protein
MPSSGIIDLAIGLIFVFGVTAALASVVTELISRFVGLRGAYLLSGLRELVDSGGTSTDLGNAESDYQQMQDLVRRGGASPVPRPVAQAAPAKLSVTGALLGGPILNSQGMVGQITSRQLTIEPATGTGRLHKMTPDRQAGGLWRQRRSLPSYISAKSFAEAVIDLVVPHTAGETAAAGEPTAAGETTMATIQRNVDALPAGLPFKSSLQALVKSAGDDVSRFRTAVEDWYDDHMNRVSGWYKRRIAIITLTFGAILIVLLNINPLTIGRTLYSNNAVSTAVSQVAAKGTNCSTSPNQQECLATLQAQLSATAAAGLPIGWGTVRDCQTPEARCNWMDQRGLFSQHGGSFGQFVLVLIGFLLMIIAIVPGAQFWFGLLSKIGTIRSTGPKPAGAGS